MTTQSSKLQKFTLLSAAVVTALALSSCGSSSAADKDQPVSNEYGVVTPGVLTVALAPADPPSSYLDESDEPTGYHVEIIKEIATDLDLTIDWKASEYSVHIPNIANGTVDTATQGALVTDERLKQVDFSTPVDFAQAVLVSEKTVGYTAFESAQGKRIGVHTDALHLAAEENIPDIEVIKYQDAAAMLNALRSGQIDAYVLGQNTALKQASDHDDITLSGAITTGQVAIPLPKGNEKFNTAVNNSLIRLAEEGILADLHKEFFPTVEIPADLVATYDSFSQ